MYVTIICYYCKFKKRRKNEIKKDREKQNQLSINFLKEQKIFKQNSSNSTCFLSILIKYFLSHLENVKDVEE